MQKLYPTPQTLPKAEIRDSPGGGKGLFAGEDIIYFTHIFEKKPVLRRSDPGNENNVSRGFRNIDEAERQGRLDLDSPQQRTGTPDNLAISRQIACPFMMASTAFSYKLLASTASANQTHTLLGISDVGSRSFPLGRKSKLEKKSPSTVASRGSLSPIISLRRHRLIFIAPASSVRVATKSALFDEFRLTS